ncbi:MAG: DMT family transporter [Arcobacter sp.]|uniref:DMT family transporter n=1 Tax=Arcobacter sp. TaxID=1872629 RepID=UPI003B00558C
MHLLANDFKYALLAVFLWSTVATAFKVSLQALTPYELLFYSSLVSSILFLSIIIKKNQLTHLFNFIKNNKINVLLSSLLNPFLYYLMLFKAYDLLPAQEAQAINYTWALVLAYFSAIFLKHSLTLKDIIAGILCYLGVLIISTKGNILGLEFSNVEGLLYAIISTVLWATYWIINTKNKFDPIISLCAYFLVSLPFITIYILIFHSFSLPSIQGLLGATYVGLFEMGITFLLWLKALQLTPKVSRISNLIFISPFISLIFIHFIVGEEIYISTLIGLIIIILGLTLQQLKKRH